VSTVPFGVRAAFRSVHVHEPNAVLHATLWERVEIVNKSFGGNAGPYRQSKKRGPCRQILAADANGVCTWLISSDTDLHLLLDTPTSRFRLQQRNALVTLRVQRDDDNPFFGSTE
jgi:hypothetical protein